MQRCLRGLIAMAMLTWLLPGLLAAADQKLTLLIDADNRTSISLDGDWHAIVDPYDNGYYDFRMQPRPDGYFRNEKPTGDKLVEYDFAKSAPLKVPGD